MAKLIYLSAAAHATDNPTKCPGKCSENTHCNAYLDIVERRLKDHSFATMRGDKSKTGSAALQSRVAEANEVGAVLYYVVHTNAGGGRYSLTLCYPNEVSKAKAKIIHKYRKCVVSHKVATRTNLYEINATKMVCLYDELFFHDNAEDCAWFHNGGMQKMAEETVQAICEMYRVEYKPEGKEEPKVEKPAAPVVNTPAAGDVVKLNKGKLYTSSTGDTHVTRTGTFYLYDGKKVNGRYRVTNSKSKVNKAPVASNVSGWIEL